MAFDWETRGFSRAEIPTSQKRNTLRYFCYRKVNSNVRMIECVHRNKLRVVEGRRERPPPDWMNPRASFRRKAVDRKREEDDTRDNETRLDRLLITN